MPKKNTYDWIALIQEQKESGMNMKQFCIDKGVSYATFKYHIYRDENRHDTSTTFIPVKKAKSKNLSLMIDGHYLSLDSEMDDTSIQRILKALIS